MVEAGTTKMISSTLAMAGSTGRRTRRILVVDDDRPSREGLSAALAREGHAVDAAGDAWQAIIRIRDQAFDIAVIDLDLPAVHGVELSGWDVVKIARAYRPDIAVIMLSADEDPTPGPEALALDVTGILGKPISLQELTRLVEALPPERAAGARSSLRA